MATKNGNGAIVKICVGVVVGILVTVFSVTFATYSARAGMIARHESRICVLESNLDTIRQDLSDIKTDLRQALKERKE